MTREKVKKLFYSGLKNNIHDNFTQPHNTIPKTQYNRIFIKQEENKWEIII